MVGHGLDLYGLGQRQLARGCERKWNFGYDKVRGISCVTDN